MLSVCIKEFKHGLPVFSRWSLILILSSRLPQISPWTWERCCRVTNVLSDEGAEIVGREHGVIRFSSPCSPKRPSRKVSLNSHFWGCLSTLKTGVSKPVGCWLVRVGGGSWMQVQCVWVTYSSAFHCVYSISKLLLEHFCHLICFSLLLWQCCFDSCPDCPYGWYDPGFHCCFLCLDEIASCHMTSI